MTLFLFLFICGCCFSLLFLILIISFRIRRYQLKMMKLTLKTIKGSAFVIEIPYSFTLKMLEKKVRTEVEESIKSFKDYRLVVHNKVILQQKEEESPIVDYGIKDGDVILLLPKRKPSQHQPLTESVPSPTKQMILLHTSYGNPVKPQPTSTPSSSTFLRRFEDLLMNSLGIDIRDNSANATTSTSVSSQSSTNPETLENRGEEQNQHPQTPIAITVDPELLRQLQDMGFPEERSRKALILNRMNVQLAMEWMLEHEADANIDEPLSEQQLAHLSRTANVTPDANLVQRLKDMGFSEEDALAAIQSVGNDQEAACGWLLGEREPSIETQNMVSLILNNPVIRNAFANPRIFSVIRAAADNPSLAQRYINDPEIGPVLMQLHSLFSSSSQ